jgi:hypothetical protein
LYALLQLRGPRLNGRFLQDFLVQLAAVIKVGQRLVGLTPVFPNATMRPRPVVMIALSLATSAIPEISVKVAITVTFAILVTVVMSAMDGTDGRKLDERVTVLVVAILGASVLRLRP